MDMRFGMWTVRSLYRAGSPVTAVKEISKCKLDVVRVQVVRWDRSGTAQLVNIHFFWKRE
jgi:hypothetical protein